MNRKIKKLLKKQKQRSTFYHQYTNQKHSQNFFNKYLSGLLNRTLASVAVLLCLLISRIDERFPPLYEYTYKHLNFMKIKTAVEDKLHGIFPKESGEHKYVGAIIIDLDNTAIYRNGVIVETNYAEPVQSCVDGIVIRIYRDAELGKVIVIQDELGREYHYGLLENIEVGMYSIVRYGDILGMGRINSDFNGEYYLEIHEGEEYLDVLDVVNES